MTTTVTTVWRSFRRSGGAGVFAWRRTAARRRVIVNLSDQAFDGVLWAKRGPLLVLRDAKLLTEGAEATPMDGEIVIDRSKVTFVQVAP